MATQADSSMAAIALCTPPLWSLAVMEIPNPRPPGVVHHMTN